MTGIQKVQMSTEGLEGKKNTFSIHLQRERERERERKEKKREREGEGGKEEQVQFKDIRYAILSDYRP